MFDALNVREAWRDVLCRMEDANPRYLKVVIQATEEEVYEAVRLAAASRKVYAFGLGRK